MCMSQLIAATLRCLGDGNYKVSTVLMNKIRNLAVNVSALIRDSVTPNA